jgi:FHA domain
MSACPQCGAAARPTDKFCNACGTPIVRASAPAAAPAYGTPPPPPFAPLADPPPLPPLSGPPGFATSGTPQGFGAAPGRAAVARCQLGHEIVGGTSYCAQGHPIALEQMHFTSDSFPGAPGFGAAPAYGAPPPLQPLPPLPPIHGYGMPPPAPPAPFGTPGQPGFGGPFLAPAAQPPAAQPPAVQPPAVQPSFGAQIGGPLAPAPIYPMHDAPREAVPAKVLRGFLVAYASNPTGDFWPLTGGRLVVGRLGSADRIDIALQDPTISSRHAAIVVDAASGTITLEDTGSTNGTFVNDEHIGFNGRRDLRDGDRLRFGAHTTIVKVIGRV